MRPEREASHPWRVGTESSHRAPAFQGFAAPPEPVPDLIHRPGRTPSASQQANGTTLKLQTSRHTVGHASLRLVLDSRNPSGTARGPGLRWGQPLEGNRYTPSPALPCPAPGPVRRCGRCHHPALAGPEVLFPALPGPYTSRPPFALFPG
jgi:hypothetical protein